MKQYHVTIPHHQTIQNKDLFDRSVFIDVYQNMSNKEKDSYYCFIDSRFDLILNELLIIYQFNTEEEKVLFELKYL